MLPAGYFIYQDNFTESYKTKLSSLLTVPIIRQIERKVSDNGCYACVDWCYLEAKGKWRPALPIDILPMIATISELIMLNLLILIVSMI